MIKAAVKASCLCLLYMFALLLASCTGRGDINNQGMVLITTIDREANGEYTIGVGILKPKVLNDESKIGNLWISSYTDITLQGSIRQLQSRSPIFPVWYSSRILLIGEKAARDGLDEIMDYLARNREIRPTVRLVTVEGRALEVLKIQVEASDNIAEQILDILEEQSKEARIHFAEKADVLSQYYKEESNPVMPRLILIKPQPDREQYIESDSTAEGDSTAGSASLIESDKSIAITGSAIYQNKRLVGWLNEKESMGLLWMKGKIDGGVIGYVYGKERVAAEIIKSNTKMNFIEDNNIPGFSPEIDVQARLVEYLSEDKITGRKLMEIESRMKETIRINIEAFVNKAYVQMKTDPALLGDMLHQKKPLVWNRLKNNWYDVLPGLHIFPKINVTISKVGFINNTLEVK